MIVVTGSDHQVVLSSDTLALDRRLDVVTPVAVVELPGSLSDRTHEERPAVIMSVEHIVVRVQIVGVFAQVLHTR